MIAKRNYLCQGPKKVKKKIFLTEVMSMKLYKFETFVFPSFSQPTMFFFFLSLFKRTPNKSIISINERRKEYYLEQLVAN